MPNTFCSNKRRVCVFHLGLRAKELQEVGGFCFQGSGKYEAWRLLLSDVEMYFANIELI